MRQVITTTHNIDHILVLSLNRSSLLTVNVVSTQFGTNMRLKLSITEGDSFPESQQIKNIPGSPTDGDGSKPCTPGEHQNSW